MKTDIFDKTPKVGDRIVFNPPKYKGLMHSKIVGFGRTGLPRVVENPESGRMWFEWNKKGYYTVKTDFVIINE